METVETVPGAVPVKDDMFPVLDKANPVPKLLFNHENVVPVTELAKVTGVEAELLHIDCEGGGMVITGNGFTVTV